MLKKTLLSMFVLVLMLMLMPAMTSLAQSGATAVASAVLNGRGITQKIINIPDGYRAASAEVTLQMTGSQQTAFSVLVGRQKAELSWPANASATLDLTGETGSSIPVSATAATAGYYSVIISIICVK